MQVLAFEFSNPKLPALVYDLHDRWPTFLVHSVNVLAFEGVGSSGPVYIFWFRRGRIQPVIVDATPSGLQARKSDDGKQIVLILPQAASRAGTAIYRMPIELQPGR